LEKKYGIIIECKMDEIKQKKEAGNRKGA